MRTIARRAAVVALVADTRSTKSNELGRRVAPPTVIVIRVSAVSAKRVTS